MILYVGDRSDTRPQKKRVSGFRFDIQRLIGRNVK